MLGDLQANGELFWVLTLEPTKGEGKSSNWLEYETLSKFPSSFLFNLIHILVYSKTQGSWLPFLTMAAVIEMRTQTALGLHILLFLCFFQSLLQQRVV